MAKVVVDPAGILRIHGISDRNVGRITDEVKDSAQRRVPVDLGQLKESIRSEHVGDTGRVFVGTDHWAPTEYGSRAHVIRSTGPWSLHNRETGEYFGREVHHPGTPEQPFMRPALYQRRALRP